LPIKKNHHRPIDHRHVEIEDEQIVLLLKRQFQGVIGFGRGIDFATERGRQRLSHDTQKSDVIAHHENAFCLTGHGMHACAKERPVSSFSFLETPPLMENTVADIIAALRERVVIIRDETSRRDPEKHIARLRTISERIDQLQAALPEPVNPQLAHYLQRKSYDKALEFLEGTGD
jgi:hypothetical protein